MYACPVIHIPSPFSVDHGGKGFPPLVAFVCVETRPRRGKLPSWRVCLKGNTMGRGFPPLVVFETRPRRGKPPSHRVGLAGNTVGRGSPLLVVFETRPRRGKPLVGASVWKETRQRREGPLLGVPVCGGHTTGRGFPSRRICGIAAHLQVGGEK